MTWWIFCSCHFTFLGSSLKQQSVSHLFFKQKLQHCPNVAEAVKHLWPKLTVSWKCHNDHIHSSSALSRTQLKTLIVNDSGVPSVIFSEPPALTHSPLHFSVQLSKALTATLSVKLNHIEQKLTDWPSNISSKSQLKSNLFSERPVQHWPLALSSRCCHFMQQTPPKWPFNQNSICQSKNVSLSPAHAASSASLLFAVKLKRGVSSSLTFTHGNGLVSFGGDRCDQR